jgi:hypothetical protein
MPSDFIFALWFYFLAHLILKVLNSILGFVVKKNCITVWAILNEFSGSFLAVPRGSEDGSSMSELSGITTASAKTYIAEESSLVIESIEKGVTK